MLDLQEKIREKLKKVLDPELNISIIDLGLVYDINIKKINNLARIAGCPFNKSAGIYLFKHVNNYVKKMEKIRFKNT